MPHKEKPFNKIWKNQTDIGIIFGLKPIAVGKTLKALGLKDKNGATQKAIDQGFAKSTPLADGTPFFMWNVEKVTTAFENLGVERQSPVEAYAAKLIRALRPRAEDDDIEGFDDPRAFIPDSLTERLFEVPVEIRQDVRDLVEIAIFGAIRKPSRHELRQRAHLEEMWNLRSR